MHPSLEVSIWRAGFRNGVRRVGHVVSHRVVDADHVSLLLRRLNRAVRNCTWSESLASLLVLLADLTRGEVVLRRDDRVGLGDVFASLTVCSMLRGVGAFDFRAMSSTFSERFRFEEQRPRQGSRVMVESLIAVESRAELDAASAL